MSSMDEARSILRAIVGDDKADKEEKITAQTMLDHVNSMISDQFYENEITKKQKIIDILNDPNRFKQSPEKEPQLSDTDIISLLTKINPQKVKSYFLDDLYKGLDPYTKAHANRKMEDLLKNNPEAFNQYYRNLIPYEDQRKFRQQNIPASPIPKNSAASDTALLYFDQFPPSEKEIPIESPSRPLVQRQPISYDDTPELYKMIVNGLLTDL